MKVYVNYPNPHITIHADRNCGSLHQQHKENQRVVSIDRSTLSSELIRFAEKGYRFGAQAENNDMWLDVSFQDDAFERAVVEYIRKLLAQYYSPFAKAKVDQHCQG
jgi:hypothetical protein